MNRSSLGIVALGIICLGFSMPSQAEDPGWILYCRPQLVEIMDDWGVFAMRPDGSSVTTIGKGIFFSPSLNRDGSVLIFTALHPIVKASTTIYKTTAAGGTPVLLAAGPEYSAQDASFSPDETRVVYQVYQPELPGGATPTPGPGKVRRPESWLNPLSVLEGAASPDFPAPGDGANPRQIMPSSSYLAIARLDGSDAGIGYHPAIPNQGPFQFWRSPDWHPFDENRILCSMRMLSGTGVHMAGLYEIDPNGTMVRPLFPPQSWMGGYEEDDFPVWSPDGRYIAYTRQFMNLNTFVSSYSVWLMREDASDAPGIQITRDFLTLVPSGGISHIDWSPDGQWIVFSAVESAQIDVYKVRPDGSELTKLTQDGISAVPCWGLVPAGLIAGVALPGAAAATETPTPEQPTPPTPTATATAVEPTPPATQTATATVTPTPAVQPTFPDFITTSTPGQLAPETLAVYEFDQKDLAANGWKEIPGGFVPNTLPGQITALGFVGNLIPSSQDQVGIQITADPGEVAFAYAAAPVDTGGKPVLVRMTLRTTAPGAAVALAALRGNLATGEGVDGTITTHVPVDSRRFLEAEERMVLLYEPDSNPWVTPVIQVAGGQSGAVSVSVDRLEVVRIDTSQAVPPEALYEFDQTTLEADGWKFLGSGFSGAQPGEVSANIYVGPFMPSSKDKVGIMMSVHTGQVAFLHTLAPIQTEGWPVLIRMKVRADGPGAAVALAALQGNLASNEGVDGTIATNIPAQAASFVDQERVLELVYQPDAPGQVTPILQAACTLGPQDSRTVAVLIDSVEIYKLDPASSYLGSMCSAKPAQEPGVTPTPTQPPVESTPTPTPTLTPTVEQPTPTPPPAGSIPEVEPNDGQATAQNLGTLAANSTTTVAGRMAKGGVEGQTYVGDSDFYAITLSEKSELTVNLDWTANANLDFYLMSNGQFIGGVDKNEKPIALTQTLDPGTYLLLILSMDNPSDYTMRIQVKSAGIPGSIPEVEPNDAQATAQNLGTLPANQDPITIAGRMAKGGVEGQTYVGDSDFYVFTITQPSELYVTLDWTDSADLDLFFLQDGQIVDSVDQLEKPIQFGKVLQPGTYMLLVLSMDNPTNYSMQILLLADATPTPTPTPEEATPTPAATATSTPAGVTPTPTAPPAGSITEVEPNDGQATAQNLGTLAVGSTTTVAGRMAKGGVEGQNYVGDSDFYAFTVTQPSELNVNLDWTGNANLDLYFLYEGQIVDQVSQNVKPIEFGKGLQPGTYLLLVLSMDNPSDYTMQIQIKSAGIPGSVPETEPNDGQATAQNLGTLVSEKEITVAGRMAKGGVEGQTYMGDSDFYAFTVNQSCELYVTLDWTANANLDLYFLENGQVVDQISQNEKPIEFGKVLQPGTYLLLVLSMDNPSDYTMKILMLSTETPVDLVTEKEPNDTDATAQNLGLLLLNSITRITGNLDSGGYDGQSYQGDIDLYTFTLQDNADVQFTMDWNVSADADIYVFYGNEIIDQQSHDEKPIDLTTRLIPGTFTLMVVSADNACDYQLEIKTTPY
ncbi:MAG: hypothetical protein ACE15F_07945 [bacterium]